MKAVTRAAQVYTVLFIKRDWQYTIHKRARPYPPSLLSQQVHPLLSSLVYLVHVLLCGFLFLIFLLLHKFFFKNQGKSTLPYTKWPFDGDCVINKLPSRSTLISSHKLLIGEKQSQYFCFIIWILSCISLFEALLLKEVNIV